MISETGCIGNKGEMAIISSGTSSQSEGYSRKWLIWLVCREPLSGWGGGGAEIPIDLIISSAQPHRPLPSKLVVVSPILSHLLVVERVLLVKLGLRIGSTGKTWSRHHPTRCSRVKSTTG